MKVSAYGAEQAVEYHFDKTGTLIDERVRPPRAVTFEAPLEEMRGGIVLSALANAKQRAAASLAPTNRKTFGLEFFTPQPPLHPKGDFL